MNNRYRMHFSFFIIIAVLCSWAECEQMEIHLGMNLQAWTGENVDLHCGTDQSESVGRYWKRGEEILTMANTVWTNDTRIESLNQSNILRINNVNVDDQGEYTCVINTKPIHHLTLNLQVKDFTCNPPEKPLNGDFKGDNNSADEELYTLYDQIHYFCNRGFELTGSAIRTCSGPPHGWTPDEPFCEPDYIVRLQKSVDVIGNKVAAIESKCTTFENKLTAMESKMTTMENKMATVENRLTAVENKIVRVENRFTTMENKMTSLDIRATEHENRMTAIERPNGHGLRPESRWIRRYDDSDELFD